VELILTAEDRIPQLAWKR